MAEDLTEYLKGIEINVQYLHSEVETLDRVGILRDLRMGVYDVIVGINLLREGLDLPEVSLVAILDADKAGFLRSATALIQTIGRASRNLQGKVIMYGDTITDAMKQAIDETNRRRKKQEAYNKKHNFEPFTIVKEIYDITARLNSQSYIADEQVGYSVDGVISQLPIKELRKIIKGTEERMEAAAKSLEFERAAVLRDQVFELRKMLADELNVPPWERIAIISGEE